MGHHWKIFQPDVARNRDMNKLVVNTRWIFHRKEIEHIDNHTVPLELALNYIFEEH